MDLKISCLRFASGLSTVGLALALLVGCGSSGGEPGTEDTAGTSGSSGASTSGGGKSGGGATSQGGDSPEAGSGDTTDGGAAGSGDTTDGGSSGNGGNATAGGAAGGNTSLGGSAGSNGGTSGSIGGVGGIGGIGGSVGGIGGTDPIGGTGGVIVIPPVACLTTATGETVTQGFETTPAAAPWVTDNSSPQAGALSAHPPVMEANKTTSLNFSCENKLHSQISFTYRGVSPAAGQTLKFYVDDVLYQTFGQTPNNGYTGVALTVPTGTHSYRWDASTAPTVAGQPPFWVDTIQCVTTPCALNTTGGFGFEEGFVPPEFGSNVSGPPTPAAQLKNGDWAIDNSSPQAGSFSVHPPLMSANAISSLDFACGGKTHSQLSFVYRGIAPAAGQTLKFYVDDVLYQTYGQTPNNGFTGVALTVPTGTHIYRWDASTAPTVAGQPPYWIDAIQCSNVVAKANTTGAFNFEEGFVPPEFGSNAGGAPTVPLKVGDWSIDNSSPQEGSFSVHPPLMSANAITSLDFACGGKTHSQLSFVYRGIAPAAGQTLKFYVDDVLYQTYGQTPNNGFTGVALTVPSGTHTYRWDASTAPTVAGQPPYWVDAIQCTNVAPKANTTGAFNFEEGFVPPEFGSDVSGQPNTALKVADWEIDNSSPQEGSLSIHPPLMNANATKSLDFACGGKTHSQLSFVYRGIAPAAGQTLKFYVDDVLYQTYGQTPNNGFTGVALTVPSGTHTYRWDASTAPTVAGQPPYWVDAIQCTNVAPKANTTGAFNFEEGFVPPEFGSDVSGQPNTALKVADWEIDNSSPQEGSLSIHPPLMNANATKSLDFACGGKTHSQLSFVYRGIAPAAGQTLKFYVDDVLYQTYGQTPNNGFTGVALTVPSGTHTYRWDASTAPTVAGQPPYWIDAIQCTNVASKANTTGAFNFEEGFVAPEFGSNATGAPSVPLKVGDWSIDNSSPQEGSYSAHPPLMNANSIKSLDFACGGKVHTKLSFVYRGIAPAAGQTLKFYVDETLNQTFGQTPNNGFTGFTLTVASGAHTYRWDATTAATVAGQPPFWVDAIQCQ